MTSSVHFFLTIITIMVVSMMSNVVSSTPIPGIKESATLDGGTTIFVSKSGNGNFKTFTQAVKASWKFEGRVTIRVSAGVYEEYLVVDRPNITIIGDGPGKTILKSSRSEASGYDIDSSGALTIFGQGFVGVGISIINVAGVIGRRSVALRNEADLSAFYNCIISSYQDTLYASLGRQFYRECEIMGTVDFIFGDASAVFQNCIIKVRKPRPGQENVITAQERKIPKGNSGFSLHNCTLRTDDEFDPSFARSYLGRPLTPYSRTTVLQTYIDSFIDPTGWLPTKNDAFLSTVVYREFDNRGPGASTAHRVHWLGYKVMDATSAKQYTVTKFIDGNSWLPQTTIPFFPDLLQG